jgi:hypothetical protein
MVPALPPELTDKILSNFNSQSNDDLKVLGKCIFVNRTFHDCALRLIYYSVVLYLACPKLYQKPSWTSFTAFYQALKRTPYISNHVKHLVLVFHPFRAVWEDTADFDKLCAKLDGVHNITLIGFDANTVPTQFLHALRRFVALHQLSPVKRELNTGKEVVPDKYALFLKQHNEAMQKRVASAAYMIDGKVSLEMSDRYSFLTCLP